MQSITGIAENDYNKYSVIKPPADFFGDNERYTRVVVDSRLRNKTLFPNPNDYEIVLDDDINDVFMAQMIYIEMNCNMYLINKYCNTLVVNVGGINNQVVLDVGDYDNNSFVAELQSKLDAVLGAGAITISYTSKTDKYKFTSASPFTLKFKDYKNSLALMLGFQDNNDYSAQGSGPFVLEADYRRNFNFNNYVIMDIDQFDLLKSDDRDLNKSFALIPKTYNAFNLIDQPQYIKRFSPPIAKLSKMRIRLYDRFGNDYDFQNVDHRFEMLLTSFKQKRKYANIFAH